MMVGSRGGAKLYWRSPLAGFARLLRPLGMMVLCVTRAKGKEAKRMDKSVGRAVQCRDKALVHAGKVPEQEGRKIQ